jgi:methionyl-tRNA formyltransferase
VKGAGLARGLPLAQPPTLKSEAGRAALSAWGPEVLIVVAYGLLLPPEVLQLPRYGCLNLHDSLLPRLRGAAPIQRPILAGDRHTGVNIMQMNDGLDTTDARERAAQISRRIPRARRDELSIAEALLKVLTGLARGETPRRSRPRASNAAVKRKTEARIDREGAGE